MPAAKKSVKKSTLAAYDKESKGYAATWKAFQKNSGMSASELRNFKARAVTSYKKQLSKKGHTLKDWAKHKREGGAKPSTKRALSAANLGRTLVKEFKGDTLNNLMPGSAAGHLWNKGEKTTKYQRQQKVNVVKRLYQKHAPLINEITEAAKPKKPLTLRDKKELAKKALLNASGKKRGRPKKSPTDLKKATERALNQIRKENYNKRVDKLAARQQQRDKLVADIGNKGGNTNPFKVDEEGNKTRKKNGKQILQNQGRVINENGSGSQED